MAAYFSKALFLRNLKRFWPIAAALFIVSFFYFIAIELSGQNTIPQNAVSRLRTDILPNLSVYTVVIVPIFSIATAVAMFGYLHKPKAAGFVSSLPVSRLGIYITNWVSGITIMLVPTLLIGAVYGVLLINQPVFASHILLWFAMIIFAYLLFYSIAVFSAFLTGKSVMQVFLFGLLNFASVFIILAIFAAADTFVFGFHDFATEFPFALLALTPTFAIPSILEELARLPSNSISQMSAILLVLYPIMTAILIFFSYRMYRGRRIESAGEIIVYKPLRSVFKYLIGLLVGAMLGVALTAMIDTGFSMVEFMVSLAISVIVFGSLGCLFAEMLIHKRLRVWKTAYKNMLWFTAGIIAIVLFIRFDVTGYERRVPNPDNVAAVSLSLGRTSNFNNALIRNDWGAENIRWSIFFSEFGEALLSGEAVLSDDIIEEIMLREFHYFESPEAIYSATRLHREIIRNRSLLEDFALRPFMRSNTIYTLSYRLNDGRVITRRYVLPDDVLIELDVAAGHMQELYSQPEAVRKRTRFADFPDNALLAAEVTWSTNLECYTFKETLSCRNCEEQVFISEDNQALLLQAMRRDVQMGTLGHLCTQGSYRLVSRHIDLDENPRIVVIRLLYNSDAVGIPQAFAQNNLRVPDTDPIVRIHGLLQHIIITENDVNTMQFLRESGFFD